MKKCRWTLLLLVLVLVGILAVVGYFRYFFFLYGKALAGNAEAQYIIGRTYYIANQPIDPQGVKWIQRSADQGYAKAQWLLGLCYEFGDGVERDDAKAVEWYQKAAEQGCFWAQYDLVRYYANGKGVEKDLVKAAEWLQKAAQYDMPRREDVMKKNLSPPWQITQEQESNCSYWTMIHVGYRYLAGDGVEKNPAKAVECFQKLEEKGYDSAYCLGICYLKGEGIENPVKAVEWLQKAVENSDETLYTLFTEVCAPYVLGSCYENGVGVEKDLAKAFEYYQKLVEWPQYGPAIYKLSQFYAEGLGVEKNPAKAMYLFRYALREGNAVIPYWWETYKIDGIEDEDIEGLGPHSVRALKKCLELAGQGDAQAQYCLGYGYDMGFDLYGSGINDYDVNQDPAKAFEWYQKSAEQGFALAQYRLGCCYENGDGVEENPAKAVEWYQKAAEQGYPPAQYVMGVYCWNGDGVERDTAKAIEWFQKAAEGPDELANGLEKPRMVAEAQYILGICYENGFHFEKDHAKAIDYWNKAADKDFWDDDAKKDRNIQEIIDEIREHGGKPQE